MNLLVDFFNALDDLQAVTDPHFRTNFLYPVRDRVHGSPITDTRAAGPRI
jgi:hypothetical protein